MTDCNHLKIFYQVAKTTSLDIAVITGEELRILPSIKNPILSKIFKVISLLLCHIELGKKIKINKDKQAIIVHGFSNEFLIFTYFSSLFKTKNVYLLTHHNIQQAFHELPSRLLLKLYSLLNYKFILNETSTILKDIGFTDKEIEKHISLLHPVVEQTNIPNNNSIRQKKIGLIGKFNKGKRIEETLRLLMELQKQIDFKIVVGTNNISLFNTINNQLIQLVNTSQKHDYQNVLKECDIIILNYDESKYFYRCSGVAADAIGTKTFVLCPNFPLMNNQISYPTQVGISYEQESGLATVIQKALELLDNNSILFENHYVERSIDRIASNFTSILEKKIKPIN